MRWLSATTRKSHYSTRLPIIDDTWIHLTPWSTATLQRCIRPILVPWALPHYRTSAIDVSRPALSVLLLAGAILHPQVSHVKQLVLVSSFVNARRAAAPI